MAESFSEVSRREFIGTTMAFTVAMSVPTTPTAGQPTAVGRADQPITVEMTVNGHPVRLALDTRVTLLDALREHLHLTGTRKGCDHGQCGACTVHVNGRRVLSCLTLAAMATGKNVATIEGLARGEQLHPVQQAFIDCDAFQCGYCTSGQIMSAVALLNEPCGPSDDDVRELMSGNLCRCGAYPNIVAAVQSVRNRE